MAANSQTSFSSHEPVPYRAVQASTSRAVEHLRWRCWSHRRLHSVRGGGTSTQTTVSFALGFKEGNCNETQRLVSAKVMTWCSIIHDSSAINERTKEKMAIKKLHRPFQSEIFAKRAYRELRLLKHMKHENVSRIKPTAHFLFPLVGLCIQRPRLLFKPGDRAARCVHACLGTRRDAGLVSIVVFVLFVWEKPSGGDRWGIRWAEVVHLWEAPVSASPRPCCVLTDFRLHLIKAIVSLYVCMSQIITLDVAVFTRLISCNRNVTSMKRLVLCFLLKAGSC